MRRYSRSLVPSPLPVLWINIYLQLHWQMFRFDTIRIVRENSFYWQQYSQYKPKSEEDSSAQSTYSGLFAGCKRRRVEPTSVSAQLASYIALCDEIDESDVLTFWSANLSRLSTLFPLAMRVLSIIASSAPVERVFSHGGLIMRPYRSRLSDKMLNNLIFLKCNTISEKEQFTQAWSVVTVRPR